MACALKGELDESEVVVVGMLDETEAEAAAAAACCSIKSLCSCSGVKEDKEEESKDWGEPNDGMLLLFSIMPIHDKLGALLTVGRMVAVGSGGCRLLGRMLLGCCGCCAGRSICRYPSLADRD